MTGFIRSFNTPVTFFDNKWLSFHNSIIVSSLILSIFVKIICVCQVILILTLLFIVQSNKYNFSLCMYIPYYRMERMPLLPLTTNKFLTMENSTFLRAIQITFAHFCYVTMIFKAFLRRSARPCGKYTPLLILVEPFWKSGDRNVFAVPVWFSVDMPVSVSELEKKNHSIYGKIRANH